MSETFFFAPRAGSPRAVRLAEDPHLDEILAREDLVDPNLIIALARNEPMAKKDRDTLQRYLDRYDDAWKEVAAIRSHDFEMQEKATRSTVSYWKRLCNMLSFQPAEIRPALANASEEEKLQAWQEIPFAPELKTSGFLRFDGDQAFVTVQSQTWEPGNLVVLHVHPLIDQVSDQSGITPILDDAVPYVEMPIRLKTPQAVQVSIGVFADSEISAELAFGIKEAFSDGSPRIQQGWRAWAQSRLGTDFPALQATAEWITKASENLLQNEIE